MGLFGEIMDETSELRAEVARLKAELARSSERIAETTERGDRYHEENNELFKRAVEAERVAAAAQLDAKLMAENWTEADERAAAAEARLTEALQKNIDWAKGNLKRVREDVQADIRLAEAFRPMTMQDIRLAAGEGKLTPQTVLSAANAVLRMRRPFVPLVSGVGKGASNG